MTAVWMPTPCLIGIASIKFNAWQSPARRSIIKLLGLAYASPQFSGRRQQPSQRPRRNKCLRDASLDLSDRPWPGPCGPGPFTCRGGSCGAGRRPGRAVTRGAGLGGVPALSVDSVADTRRDHRRGRAGSRVLVSATLTVGFTDPRRQSTFSANIRGNGELAWISIFRTS